MSDNIRDRIAAAIRQAAADQTYWVPGPVLSRVYADAVIYELGLKDEKSGEPEKTLLERVVIAVLEALTDDDPFVLVAIGDHEIHVNWERTDND